jgi:hypothetical protein
VYFAALTGLGLLVAPFTVNPIMFMVSWSFTNVLGLIFALTIRKNKESDSDEES